MRETKQGSLTVTQYFGILTKLWQELNLFLESDWNCSHDSVKYTKMLEKERVFEFLAGLNKELDEVRGRVLGKETLPSIHEVYSEVRREESRRKVMMGDPNPRKHVELVSSALVSKELGNQSNSNGDQRMKKRGEKVWCEFCHRPRHTKATCWKLHGMPSNWKSNRPVDTRGYIMLEWKKAQQHLGIIQGLYRSVRNNWNICMSYLISPILVLLILPARLPRLVILSQPCMLSRCRKGITGFIQKKFRDKKSLGYNIRCLGPYVR